MKKIPATLIVVVLLATVASVAARPILNTAISKAPSMIIEVNVGSQSYAVDIRSVASLLLSPETAVSAVVHGIQDAATPNEHATVPVNEHQVVAGESVHITHMVENQAVTVSVEVTVTVGEPATVVHSTEPHPPEPEHPGSD